MLSLLLFMACGEETELKLELKADDGSVITVDGGQGEVVVTDGEGNTVKASGSTEGGDASVTVNADDQASIKIGEKGVEATAGGGKAGVTIAEDKVEASAGGGDGVELDVVDGAATFKAGGGDEFEMAAGQGAVGIKGGEVNVGDIKIDFKKKK